MPFLEYLCSLPFPFGMGFLSLLFLTRLHERDDLQPTLLHPPPPPRFVSLPVSALPSLPVITRRCIPGNCSEFLVPILVALIALRPTTFVQPMLSGPTAVSYVSIASARHCFVGWEVMVASLYLVEGKGVLGDKLDDFLYYLEKMESVIISIFIICLSR